jgi:hypothetical protein
MTHPSSLYVVVESRSDADLIRAILGNEIASRIRFFAAGGRASLATVGRNILVHEGGPILLVMDSETRSEQLVDEQKSMVFLAMSGVAPPNLAGLREWVKVFAFVPEIEVIFFEAATVLELLLGKKVPEEKLQEGMLVPKATLTGLLADAKTSHQALIASITPDVASVVTTGRQARALKTTIESMLKAVVTV